MKDIISIPNVAWLYFLHYVYNGKLNINSWLNDNRMSGINCNLSLNKFNCVKKINGFYISSNDCVDIIDKYFGTTNFNDSIRKIEELKEYSKKDNLTDYPIDYIPYNLFLYKNPNIQKSFDTISNKIRAHFNSQRCTSFVIDNILKTKHLDKFNFKQYYVEFNGEPKEIKLYRGIKNKFEKNFNKKHYSCWTTNKKQAIRFAKYIFSGGLQFKPTYSENPHILETEVNFDDILIFIGGDEHEVILKNPINITKINKL